MCWTGEEALWWSSRCLGSLLRYNCDDRDQTTKWMTTGSFPQEIVVQLATTASISRVKTWSTNAKEVAVEVCSGPTPTKWEKLYDSSQYWW